MHNGPELILVLCRTKERNGIAMLSSTMVELQPDNFAWVRSVTQFIGCLVIKRRRIAAIIGMSDIETIIAVSLCRALRVEVPILLGVYHPRQWSISLNKDYSKRRALVFEKVLDSLPASNVISSSSVTLAKCAEIRPKFAVGCALIAGPVTLKGASVKLSRRAVGSSIVTVGRFVDFKVCTVEAMIGIVEILNEMGREVSYHIYGEGPAQASIEKRIRASRWRERIYLNGALEQEVYARTVTGHTVFFGMGSSLVQAALAGMPCLVAIQGEVEAVSFGPFAMYDHWKRPIFGDPEPSIARRQLLADVLAVLEMDEGQWHRVAGETRDTAVSFGPEATLKALKKTIENAKVVTGCSVSLRDLLVIRIQAWWSRIRRKPTMHA